LLSKNLKIKIYRTIILPVVLYGCETWSLKFRVEHRLRVFENRVLRRIFVHKRDEVTGEWRKLHNEELHDLLREESGVCRVLVGKPEGDHGRDPGIDGRIILGVYVREGTTLRVKVADRPYGEFYDLYSVSPEYTEFTYTYQVHENMELQ
jgi:hypothetical protein